MTNANANDVRRAHKLLDYVSQGRAVLDEELKLLRSFLPDLPKQKTLEEILEEVESAACSMMDSYWSQSLNPQDWLWELHAQLKGLKGAPVTVPALPAGMRLADHKDYGRCVVSPGLTGGGLAIILALNDTHESGAMWAYTRSDSLTFAEEPAKPAHPEFLETEADYRKAPEGTIVAKDDVSTAWIKRFGAWTSTDGDCGVRCPNWKVGHRIILRWGWKK